MEAEHASLDSPSAPDERLRHDQGARVREQSSHGYGVHRVPGRARHMLPVETIRGAVEATVDRIGA